MVLAAMGAIAAAYLGNMWPSRAAKTPTIDPEMQAVFDSMVIPPFELVGIDGEIVTRDVFQGQWTVLAFMFTHCNMACPVLTQKMMGVMDQLKGTQVRFLSISVDPVNDTSLRLKEHAKELHADTARWRWITAAGSPDPSVLKTIITSLGFEISSVPDNPIDLGDGRSMENIAHPTRFVLVGPDVRVHGIYQGNDDDDLARLVAEARAYVSH